MAASVASYAVAFHLAPWLLTELGAVVTLALTPLLTIIGANCDMEGSWGLADHTRRVAGIRGRRWTPTGGLADGRIAWKGDATGGVPLQAPMYFA